MKKNITFLLLFCFTVLLSGCTSDNNIKNIMRVAKVKQNVAEDIFSKFKSIGYTKIDNIKCNHHKTENFFCTIKNYDFFAEGTLFLYLSVDGTVKNISSATQDFYKDNKIIANIYEHSITTNDFIYLVKNSEEKTKIVLNSPSSAVFPKWQEWGASFSKDKVFISAYVDSQNSFGAMVRTPIEFVYNRRQKYNNEFEYSFNSAIIGEISIK